MAGPTINFSNLEQVYNGTARVVTVTTSPTNLAVVLTYNGISNAPTNVGSYTVIGTINDLNYQGSATNTLVISPVVPVITQAPTASSIVYGQTLASSTLSNGVASTPGLFAFTSPGLAPNAGTTNVSVTFTPINTNDYTGAITNVTVVVTKALGTVVLSNLAQVYNGTARVVTASTTPTNLVVNLTYNGSGNAPTNAGSYTVIGTINDANYQGSTTNTLVINLLSGLIFSSSGFMTNITLSSGYYDITARGAQGGDGSGSGNGGLGAEMKGRFYFSSATNITILVGSQGGLAGGGGGGGGGGSFVVLGASPLLIAGGGGGGGGNSVGGSGNTNSNGSSGGNGGAGGTGGSGGSTMGTAGGGGGYNGDGAIGRAGGGLSYLHGGNGGSGGGVGGLGGFGGGGGGNGAGAGGGGGGYSGGGGGYAGGGGGGGGSYITVPATFIESFAGVQSGDGLVVISNIASNQITPIITAIPVAGAITYGQTLAFSTLTGGSADVPGIFIFTIPTIVPNAGVTNVFVSFIPSDLVTYSVVTNPTPVSVVVNKGTPLLQTALSGTGITYGQAISNSVLSGAYTNVAGAAIAGTLAYTNPAIAPNAGSTNVFAKFTPNNLVNYFAVTNPTAVSVSVAKATPVVTVTGAASFVDNGMPQGPTNATVAPLSTGALTFSYAGTNSTVYAASSTRPSVVGAYYVIATVAADTNYNQASSSAVAFAITNAIASQSMTNVTSGVGTWVVPAGVSNITVEAWGGGGGGGGDSATQGSGGGGGGGGAYAKVTSFAVTPGASYSYTVGSAGTAGASTPTAGGLGGTSSFNSTTCVAVGGAGGAIGNGGAGGSGGPAASSTGDVKYNGGTGFTPTVADTGGGGGGSAGTGGAGNNATSASGAVAVTGGGPGGGNVMDANGTAPVSGPGGGGGGGGASTAARSGGAGYAGQIIISYKLNATVSLGNLTQTHTGNSLTPTASTAPAGLALTWSYLGINGTSYSSSSAPTNAGTYTATATVNDAAYAGSSSGTLTILKQTPLVATNFTGSGIVYGQTLTNSTPTGALTNGLGVAVPGTFAYTNRAIAPLVGATNVFVAFTPTDAVNYNNVTNLVTVSVVKGTPIVQVATVASGIVYGQMLASSVLTGGVFTNLGGVTVAMAATNFVDATIAPNAGSTNVLVAYTPADLANYNAVTNTVSVAVAKQTTTVETVPNSTAITYGQTLASSTLSNGVASTPGIFTFTTPSIAPNAGTTNVSVTFTPSNTNDYTGATTNVTVAVNKAFGTVVLSNLVQVYNGGARLATASTTPTNLLVALTYNGSGNAPTNAGSYTVIGTINDANYQGSTTNTLVISLAGPMITQAPTASAITYGQTLASSTLSNGVASTPGTFSFTSPSLAPNAGTTNVSVTFTPSNTNDYTGATTNVTVAVNKAFGTVVLSNLVQVYNGGARLATASTTPTNLLVALTYNGSGNAPTNAGSYTVIGTINDANYQGSATNTLVISTAGLVITQPPTASSITYGQTLASSTLSNGVASTPGTFSFTSPSLAPNAGTTNVSVTFTPSNTNDYTGTTTNVSVLVTKALGTVVLSNLVQVYNGTAGVVAATTTPTNLAVVLTYNGSSNAPTNAGSYTVIGTINDANYQGSATNTLIIDKVAAVVTLGNLNQTYDGAAKLVNVITYPPGLAVAFKYNGFVNAPTNVGSYAATGTINDVNYQGSATNTLVIGKATGLVILGSLNQIYDGTSKSVTAMTDPPGLAVAFTYNESSNAPANAGGYTVIGTINDPNYQGSATNTLAISTAVLVITQAPTASAITYGQTLASSTLSNGVASVPGIFSFTSPGLAPNAGTTNVSVTFTPSNTNYYTGVTTNVTVVVTKALGTVVLSNLSQIYNGTARAVTAGTTPTNLLVALTYNGSGDAPTNTGSYTVIGTINDANYQGSTMNTLVISTAGLVITQAPTASSITYGQTLASSTLSNGVASTPGTFSFTSPSLAPNAGTTNVSVTFTPSNTNDYTGTMTNVSVLVTKALGTVVLSNLAQIYNGTARVVTVTTTPINLAVTLTYNGSGNAPTNAGSYTVIGTINDANYQGSTTNTLVISTVGLVITQAPTASSIVYGQTLASSILSNGVASTPGLFTFTSPGLVPNAGTTNVSVTFTPSNTNDYTGTTTNVSVLVTKALGTVVLSNLVQVYNGTVRLVTATTMPTNLAVVLTYNGSINAPTNAGSYTVIGTLNDANYQGSATNTLMIDKVAAVVTLGNLNQTYDGAAKLVNVITYPPGLAVAFKYNGFVNAPTNVGSYAATGTINDVNYQGSATNTLVIGKATGLVILGSLNQIYDGTSKSVTATTVPSGLTIKFTYNESSNAPANAGSYTVIGTINDANYQGSATNTLVISTAGLVITQPPTASSITYGQTLASSTLSNGVASTPGTFSFTSPSLAPNAGTTNVSVTFTPSNTNDYTGASTNVTVTVTKAFGTVVLSNMVQVYNGTAGVVAATTTPTNLAVVLTYNGSSNAPTNAGSYTVIGTINDANYQGSATNTLMIDKVAAVVTLGNLNQTYDGAAKLVNVITYPPGLAVAFKYNGFVNAPTNVGSYAATGTINDVNYQGNATNTLVIGKATGLVILGSLNQIYDGTSKSVTAMTDPPGLAVAFTYNESSNAPANAGSYTVIGNINDANYAGSTTNAFTIYPAGPTILQQPTNQTVILGATAIFNVVAVGAIPLHYQWRSNGVNIASATNTTLALYNVSTKAGVGYSVIITNFSGSVTSSLAQLTVVLQQAPLFLNKIGLGTFKGATNSQKLVVGTLYKMSAKPAKGFVFKNWVDGLGNQLTNKTKLTFLMRSNLSLTANFIETSHPKLNIISPVKNAKLNGSSVGMIGTASDVWAVTNVTYSVNGGGWNSASTANNYSNWTATVALAAGTNTIRVFAQNRGGLSSLTNSLNVIVTNVVTLNLVINPQNQAPMQARAMAVAVPVNKGFTFSLELSAGVPGHIEYSTDLVHWTTWTNFDGSSTLLQFNDSQAVESRRFYRAVTP